MRSIGFIGSVFVLALGCSAQALDEAPREDNAAAAIGACRGTTPRAPVCNTMKCTPDGWTAWPIATGAGCLVNGQHGTCDGGETAPGTIEPLRIGQCVPTYSGSFSPKYYILDIVYAPPGTAGGSNRSSVDYATGSSAGTEVKESSSFKIDDTLTADVSIVGVGVSNTDSFSVSQASDNGLSVKKSQSFTISDHGPATDGIDHDSDLIYLWLNPMVDVVANGKSVKYTLSTDGAAMNIQWVSVGQLKNPSTLPPGVRQQLAARGITSADYQTMLSQDPFAYGSTAIDTGRFVQASVTLPYEPPIAKGDQPPSAQLSLTNETTHSQGSTSQSSYAVGFTIKASSPVVFASWLSANLSQTNTYTWQDTSQTTSTSSATQSASVTMTGPSFGYTGATDIAVYVDTIYNTFLFAPMPASAAPSIVGVVTDAHGAPVVGLEVVATTAAGRRRTMTGASGAYRVYGAPAGLAQVSVGGVSHPVSVGAARVQQTVHQDFVVAR